MRIEAPEIVLEGGRRIALGIDGDKERGGAVRVAPETAHDLGDVEQGGGTYLGAVGEAEEDEERLALEVLVRGRASILVDEPERSADRRRRNLDAARRRARAHDQQDAAEAEREARHEGAEHENEARGALGHS